MDYADASTLVSPLRRHIGDTTETYTYTDDELEGYILDAVKALAPRWNNRYYVGTVDGTENQIIRNPSSQFQFSSPPAIQGQDERPIILQASITIKGQKKWTESGNAVSWRDEEFSYSNIESARQRSSSVEQDMAELDKIFPVKLANGLYGRLKGWSKDWE